MTSKTNRQNQSELKNSKNSGRSRPPQFAKILKDDYDTEKSTVTPTTTDKISLTFTITPLQY
jgi:hypothetical protein